MARAASVARWWVVGAVAWVCTGAAEAALTGTWYSASYYVDQHLGYVGYSRGSGGLNDTFSVAGIDSNGEPESDTFVTQTQFFDEGAVTLLVDDSADRLDGYRNVAEQVIVNSRPDAEGDFALTMFVQPGTDHTAADLDGTWHWRELYISSDRSCVGYTKADGTLNGSLAYSSADSDGDSDSGTASCTATLSSSGRATIRIGGAGTYTARMNAARDLLIGVAGDDGTDDDFNVFALVKQGTSHSAADLRGRWALASLFVGPGFNSLDHVGQTSGSGLLDGTFNRLRQDSHGNSWNGLISIGSSITPSGEVTIESWDGLAFEGRMNASKTVILVAGSRTGDYDFGILVRLPVAAPSALSATPVSGSQIDLSWTDNAEGETGFRLERRTGPDGTWAQVATLAVDATSYHDSGLAPGTSYCYRLRATGHGGDSGYSNEACARTLSTPPGAGTSANPYRISELGHLVWMAANPGASVGKHYRLENDIDAAETAGWNDPGTDASVLEGFLPIGTEGTPFAGDFDGQGYVLRGLTINRVYVNSVGLFGHLSYQGAVRRLGLVGGSVAGQIWVGAMVGLSRGTLTQCHATSAVRGGGQSVGGLVGFSEGTLRQCYATGAVSGGSSVGGLLGNTAGGWDGDSIEQCYATGTVTGYEDVGGLIGSIWCGGTAVVQCYATGATAGDHGVGGLIGSLWNEWDGGSIEQCYATSVVSGIYDVGGLVGSRASGTEAECYWDTEASGQTTSAGGESRTTEQMRQRSTYVGWDFAGVWSIVEGQSYPYLRWSPPRFAVTAAAQGPGSVALTPVQADYAVGMVVTLQATAGVGGEFVRWQGPVASPAAARTTLVVGRDVEVMAVFRSVRGISSIQELQKIGADPGYSLDGRYWLTQDVDATETASWNDVGTDASVLEGFRPIGSAATPFTGEFDGNGHVICGLTINRVTASDIGLVGCLGSGGVIRRVGLESSVVIGAECVGGVLGYGVGGLLEACSATGAVTGCRYVGGLVGLSYDPVADSYAAATVTGENYIGGLVGLNFGTVTACQATGAVTGINDVGGLVGSSDEGALSECYATGAVGGQERVGGLVGFTFGGQATQCYATGVVTGESAVGGLIGNTTGGSVAQCYATGAVSGTKRVGGLIGYNSGGTLAQCYATGELEGGSLVGGLVGDSLLGTVEQSYWDTETSGQAYSDGGEGHTAAEMRQQNTYAGWDFAAVWGIHPSQNNGYPYFAAIGTLTVMVSPPAAVAAGAQWTADDGTTWNASGALLSLPVGQHTVSFCGVPGWAAPASQSVTVVVSTPAAISGDYTAAATGTVRVTIAPVAAVAAGARWSADGGMTWNASGASRSLPIGQYTVSFKGVAGWSTPADQNAAVTDGGTTTLTGAYTAVLTGTLAVTISPQAAVTAGAQWSANGGATWNASGASLTLPVGSYTVSFKGVAGWFTPANQNAAVTDGGTTALTGSYTLIPTGTLTVTITPPAAVTAGAQWSADGGTTWNASGAALTLPVGSYTVSFKGVSGWSTPLNQSAAVTDGGTTALTGAYTLVPTGTLTVTIMPLAAATAGARWSADGGTTWNASGAALTLNVGPYVVSFKGVAGWFTPANQFAWVTDGGTTTLTGEYIGAPAFTDAPALARTLSTGAQVALGLGIVNGLGGTLAVRTVSGSLPSGLSQTLDVAGSQVVLSGKPSRTGTYALVLEVQTTVGATTTVGGQITVTLTVVPVAEINPAAVGSYVGTLFDADPAKLDSRAVRGTLTLTAATTGKLRIKLALRSKTYSFSIPSWTQVDEDGTLWAEYADARTGAFLAFSLGPDGRGTGSFDASEGYSDLELARVPWHRTNNPASAYIGYYTVSLPVVPVPEAKGGYTPYGSGYLVFKVGTDGKTTYSGKMADGARVSGSTVLVETADGIGVFTVFDPLYSKGGYLAGQIQVLPPETEIETAFVYAYAAAKPAQPFFEWSYPGKRPTQGLTDDAFTVQVSLFGVSYAKGTTLDSGEFSYDEAILRTLSTLDLPADNAYPYSVGGATRYAVEVAIPRELVLAAAAGRLTAPAATKPVRQADRSYVYNGDSDAALKLTYSSSTGVFKGSFKLYYDYQTTSWQHKTLTVKFEGVLTPSCCRVDLPPLGHGFFQVLDADALPGYSLKRSYPIWLDPP